MVKHIGGSLLIAAFIAIQSPTPTVSKIVPDSTFCPEFSFHIKSLLSEYFKDQTLLTVIQDYNEMNDDTNIWTYGYDLDVFSCIIGSLDIPYMKFSNIRNLFNNKTIITENFLSAPSATHAYMMLANNLVSIQDDLEILSAYNTNTLTKYVAIFMNATEKNGVRFLRSLWKVYRIKKVICFITTLDGLVAIVYNPFIFRDNGTGQRGLIYKFYINSTNFNEANKNITRLIDEQDLNLYQYPIKTYMYEGEVNAVAIRDQNNHSKIDRFTRFDGEILSLLAKKMNFTSVFIGNLTLNNFVGSRNAIELNQADLAANSRIITDYKTNHTIYLRAFYMINLEYIVPKKHSQRALNVLVYDLFDLVSHITLVVVFIALIIIWYLLNFIFEKFTKKPEGNSIPRALLIVMATQYFVSLRLPKFLKGHQQILLGAMLIYGIIVSNNYQSSVVHQLASEPPNTDINTLEKLVASDLNIYFQAYHEDFITPPPNMSRRNIHYRLFQKGRKQYRSDAKTLNELTKNRSAAILVSDLKAVEAAAKYFDNKTGENLIYVIPEKAGQFYASYIVPKNSPYRNQFNEILGMFLENGCVQYEMRKNILAFEMNTVKRGVLLLDIRDDPKFKPISASQLRSLFMAWSGMLLATIFVFLIEVYTFRRIDPATVTRFQYTE